MFVFTHRPTFELSQNRRLEGKVVVVTASTDGIGLAIAERALQEGASVVVSSRKKANVDKTVADFQARGFKKVFGVPCHVGQVGGELNFY